MVSTPSNTTIAHVTTANTNDVASLALSGCEAYHPSRVIKTTGMAAEAYIPTCISALIVHPLLLRSGFMRQASSIQENTRKRNMHDTRASKLRSCTIYSSAE